MDLIRGYRYTTKVFIKTGDFSELKKLAKRENRKLRREHRLERFKAYPIPGLLSNWGQLCILY